MNDVTKVARIGNHVVIGNWSGINREWPRSLDCKVRATREWRGGRMSGARIGGPNCQVDVTSLYCFELFSHMDFNRFLSQQPANFRGRG